MKYIKFLKAALAIGNIISIIFVIISSIVNGIDTDRAPLILAIIAILIPPLILIVIYGLHAYKVKNDTRSYFVLLLISFLFDFAYVYIIYEFLMYSKLFLLYPQWFIFSILMLLLWVLNVIVYFNIKKNKSF